MAAAGGCANGTGDTLAQDVARLRQDVTSLNLSVHRAKADTDTGVSQLDRRSREQSAESARHVAALGSRLDGIAAELARLSVRVEEVSGRVETLSRQSAIRPPPTPAPPSATPPASPTPATQGGSSAPAGPSSASPGPAPAAPQVIPAPRIASEGPGAEQAYQTAYLDFSKGSFPLAISGFREVVRRFPDSPRANQAQYWIGESLFSLARASADAGKPAEATRQLEQAVQEFRRVVLDYPRGEKVPTAIYKEALALLDLKQTNLARARLRYVIEHFPQSEEAPLAKDRLAKLPS
ncbi:MAG TPA: tetratricopeptide repeat protein [Candidatus Limnocylindrales bacterium]|nr:tetratricopeptide repeat protein [Candidatus Limnocylindrales bacterium]